MEALRILVVEPVDVVVSDEDMPGMRGCELLATVREHSPGAVRIRLSGKGSLETAIHAINDGEIYRFLTKPCNTTDLAHTIRHALTVR